MERPSVGPTVISLCSGIGGIERGVERVFRGARTVCYVEREAFACALLVEKMEAARLDPAPIWTDLLSFDGRPWRGRVDIVTSGIPCQPYSLAGKRAGNSDERALWPELVRIVGECEPAIVFVENTPQFLWHSEPLWTELGRLGFEAAPPLLSTASQYGAIFDGERIFLLFAAPDRAGMWLESWRSERARGAYPSEHRDDSECAAKAAQLAERESHDEERAESWIGTRTAPLGRGMQPAETEGERRREGRAEHARDEGGYPASSEDRQASQADGLRREQRQRDVSPRRGKSDAQGSGEQAPAPDSRRLESQWRGWVFDRERQTLRHDVDGCYRGCRICGSPWEAESPACRVDDGFPDRLDRLFVLGNAVCPTQAEHAMRTLLPYVAHSAYQSQDRHDAVEQKETT